MHYCMQGSVNPRKEAAGDIYTARLAAERCRVCQPAAAERTLCAAAPRTGSIESFCGGAWPEIIPLYGQAGRPLPALGARGWRLAAWPPASPGLALRGGRPLLRQLRAQPGHTSPSKGNLARAPDFMTSSLRVPPLSPFFFFPLCCSRRALRELFKVTSNK